MKIKTYDCANCNEVWKLIGVYAPIKFCPYCSSRAIAEISEE